MPGLQDVVFGGVQSPASQVVVEISLDGGASTETPEIDQIIQEAAGIMNGSTQLILGQDYIDVAFGSEQPSANWVFIGATIFNGTDATPLNVWPGVVTSRTKSGFRLQLNGVPDTGNYYLYWSIKGVFGYYLSGPASGMLNTASSLFNVRLPDGSTMSGTAIITPHSDLPGIFTPATVSLTAISPAATFTYTPTTYGLRSISTTNNMGLDDPAQLGFTVVVSTYTFSGPSSGDVGVASTDFTVALPFGGAVTGTVTVTPDDNGAGGTFTPTTVNLTTASPSATFTYTPSTVGTSTISVTNNGGLTNPADLTYDAAAAFLDEFTGTSGLSSHTADTGQTWGPRIYAGGSSIINVASGSAYGSSVGGDDVSVDYTPPTANHEVTITIIKGSITGSPEVGAWLRVTTGVGTGTGYVGRYAEGSGFQFYRLDTGISFVQIGTNTAGSLADGDTLKFTISGTGATVSLELFKNGVSVASATDTSGSRIVTNGRVGLHIYDPSDGTGNYRVNQMVSP